MLMNTKEVQIKLGLGRDTTYSLMRSKFFPSLKIGGRYYVSKEALERWLKQQEGKNVII